MNNSIKYAMAPGKARRSLLGLMGAACFFLAPDPALAQGLTMANPEWNITLTDYGYSDFLLDNTPGFQGREYLSGEWGAAIAYQVAGSPAVPPKWLEPQFSYPDWLTGSPFHVVTPLTQLGVNAENLPIAESVIANPDLEITLRYEMLDTVVGTPMGTTPASSAGPLASIQSSRYVLKQTATIKNLRTVLVSNLQLFQFLHGLQSQRGVYDNHAHSGPFSGFRYDTTLAGVDAWAVGAGSSSDGLEDFIGFQASMAPTAYEIGYYGIEGNGVDDHWSAKPSDGVHLSIEDNWLTPPFSTREGTDFFAPPQRWIAGAQRWDLGTLGPGLSVSFDVLLSVRTGTRVATGTSVAGGCNGGSSVPGGVDYEFSDVSIEGSCFGEYAQADDAELAVRIAAGEFETFTFLTPGKPAQTWDVSFTGTHAGTVQLTFGYDPTTLPAGFDENTLCLFHFVDGAWQELTSTVNLATHTITVTVPHLSPFALGIAAGTPQHTVAASPNPPGSGTATGSGTYADGSSVSVVATANAGYAFVNWTEGGSEVSASPSYTFTLSGNRTLVANFAPVGGGKAVSTTSLPTNGGATSGDGVYAVGSIATVTATAAPGYKFSKWLENGLVVSIANPLSFTVTGNRTLVAKFKPVYALTLIPEPAAGGELEGDPFYEVGELAKLKAKPNGGYAFVNWTQNGVLVSTDPNFQFSMTSNLELVGTFAEGNRIDTSSIPPHAGQTTGAGVYGTGSMATVEALPAPGYVFLSWTDSANPGITVSTSAAYTFVPTASQSLVANFDLEVSPTAAELAYFRAVMSAVGRVDVAWGTLVEVRSLGFVIERALPDGPWERVTARAVPALGTDQQPHAYGLEDLTAPRTAGLRYRLIEVDLAGHERVIALTTATTPMETKLERTATGLRLRATGTPNGTAVVESTTAVTGPWTEVARVPLGSTGILALDLDPRTAGPVRFYRARSE